MIQVYKVKEAVEEWKKYKKVRASNDIIWNN